MLESRGYCIFAQKNNQVDYVRQAYALALSIKTYMPLSQVCLITNVDVPAHMKKLFDHIVDIPGDDDAVNSEWKIENRYKIYQATPYEHSIILDADMLVCSDISHWWDFLKNFDLFFTTQVRTYRNEIANSTYYRKTFKNNQLPNLYCGMHYYKKCRNNGDFLGLLKQIVLNYKLFYEKYTPNNTQTWCSMDVSVAIASKLLGITEKITSKVPYIGFTHMKPQSQGWEHTPDHWMEKVNIYYDSEKRIKLGNFLQQGILHYVEPEFLSEQLMNQLEKNYNG